MANRRGSTLNSDSCYENTGLRRASVQAAIAAQREISAGWGTKFGPAPTSVQVRTWSLTPDDSSRFTTFNSLYGGESADALAEQAELANHKDMRVKHKSSNLEGVAVPFSLGQRVEIFWRGNWQYATVDYVNGTGVTVAEISSMSCDGRHLHIPFNEDGTLSPSKIRVISGSRDPGSFTATTPAQRGEFAGLWSNYVAANYRTGATAPPQGSAASKALGEGWGRLAPRGGGGVAAAKTAGAALPAWGEARPTAYYPPPSSRPALTASTGTRGERW